MKFSRNRTRVVGDFALECIMITYLNERKVKTWLMHLVS
jgi:hypothetical protein